MKTDDTRGPLPTCQCASGVPNKRNSLKFPDHRPPKSRPLSARLMKRPSGSRGYVGLALPPRSVSQSWPSRKHRKWRASRANGSCLALPGAPRIRVVDLIIGDLPDGDFAVPWPNDNGVARGPRNDWRPRGLHHRPGSWTSIRLWDAAMQTIKFAERWSPVSASRQPPAALVRIPDPEPDRDLIPCRALKNSLFHFQGICCREWLKTAMCEGQKIGLGARICDITL